MGITKKYSIPVKTLFTILLCICFYRTPAAQQADNSNAGFYPLIGISSSYAPTSFKAWGAMQNTQQFMLKVEIFHSYLGLKTSSVEVSSELILPGWIRFPVDGRNGPRNERMGLGLIPFRLHLPFMRKDNHPFLTTSAGFLFTELAFPDERGTRLNYLLDFGLGYRFRLTPAAALQAGYNLHHLSNGGTGIINPGVDSHMFFISILLNR